MVSFFPKVISNKAIAAYIASLALVSIVYMDYAMSFKFMLIGLLSVLGFFYFSNKLTVDWKIYSEKAFRKNVFLVSFAIRFAWVVFSYFFFMSQTGTLFEWDAADSISYHELPAWMVQYNQFDHIRESVKTNAADCGQYTYTYFIYKIVGYEGWFPIMFVRFLKAIWGAFTCVLIYNLAKRNFGDSTGRMAAIFCMLMPNLIMYTGFQLKETEMTFLIVAFLERADYALRSQKKVFLSTVLALLLGCCLFFYRTVLGVVALFSFGTAVVFSNTRIVGVTKKIVVGFWVVLAITFVAGSTVVNEVAEKWENRNTNVELKRDLQERRGNKWAKYATGGVMAPMAFVLPFSTMVDVDLQYNQQLKHGGCFVKNVMGIFVVIAFFSMFFVSKKWRDFALIWSFTFGYLAVISLSGFSNSERFHFPAIPLLMSFAAYGVSLLNKKYFKFVKIWMYVVVLMEFAWAFFKLGSRGMF